MNIKKLDRVFSEYIRRRNADCNGRVKCCTCPTIKHWKQMDCGHYYRRAHLSVRVNEINAHAQCVHCNRFLDGNITNYILFMKSKYSAEQLDDLLMKTNLTEKFMQFEIDELTKYYQDKINEL